MKTIIFDGRKFSRKKGLQLSDRVSMLLQRGITPKLVSILVGNNPASVLYTSLKKNAAEGLGIVMEVLEFGDEVKPNALVYRINKLNEDPLVHGIMIQLPIPGYSKSDKDYVLNSVSPKKDVDGLRNDSVFIPATVKAVIEVLGLAGKINNKLSTTSISPQKVVVVGADGSVGKSLMRELGTRNYTLEGYDIETEDLQLKTIDADILISATGEPELIKGDMVKEGAIVIDVGSPKGDVNFEEVSRKASFITPVPGGIGPVTIISLLDNLVIAAGGHEEA